MIYLLTCYPLTPYFRTFIRRLTKRIYLFTENHNCIKQFFFIPGMCGYSDTLNSRILSGWLGNTHEFRCSDARVWKYQIYNDRINS